MTEIVPSRNSLNVSGLRCEFLESLSYQPCGRTHLASMYWRWVLRELHHMPAQQRQRALDSQQRLFTGDTVNRHWHDF